MTSAAQTPLAREIAGALDWWREAGIDTHFSDDAQPLLGPKDVPAIPLPTAAQAEPLVEPKQPIGGDRANWPQDLTGFAAWWLTEPSLDQGDVANRVAPRGPAKAKLMVLVAHPEAEDSERLLSGPQGKLLAAILQAMGIAEEEVYFASALPRQTPHPDWIALAEAGLADLLVHHIALAAPERLIAFGQNILPLIGHDPTKTADNLPQFNHEGRIIPLLPAMELGVYQTAPRRKAALWQRWLDWTG